MLNYILNNENAILYECGYTCDNALFLRLNGAGYLITDARYDIEARELVKQGINVICTHDLQAGARALIRKFKIKKLEFDPASFSVASFEALKNKSVAQFKPVINLSQKMREVKDESALDMLKHAANVGKECFRLMAEYINLHAEGKTEKELHKKAVEIFSDHGNRELSFNPILAINKNAAKAHALPGNDRLKVGDLILLDAGVRINGYCSDCTRTAEFKADFSFDKNQSFKDTKKQEIYNLVLNAQKAAISAIAPGKKASDIDKTARDVIAKAGYDKQFFHSTGHGVGIDIHELPRISKASHTVLKEGMVFSVEPGVYIEGEFGVRIEDVVVVTKTGCEIL